MTDEPKRVVIPSFSGGINREPPTEPVADATATWAGFLLDMHRPAIEHMRHRSTVLLDMLERDAGKRAEADRLYLESLSPHARRVELTRRRIARLEWRLARWLEDNLTWRFARERPDCDC